MNGVEQRTHDTAYLGAHDPQLAVEKSAIDNPWLRGLILTLPGIIISTFLLRVLIIQGGMPRAGDVLGFFYQVTFMMRQAVLAGTLPFWNPYTLSGAPLLADPATASFYPVFLVLTRLLGPTEIIIAYIWLHFLLSYVGMLAFLRSIRLSLTASLFGTIAFAFSGYVFVRLGAIPLLGFTSWIPMLFFLLERTLQATALSSRIFAAVFFGSGIALLVLVGFPQGAYFTLVSLGVYLVAMTLRREHLRSRRGFDQLLKQVLWSYGLPGVIAVGIAAIQLVPSLEFVSLTTLSDGYSGTPNPGLQFWDLWAFLGVAGSWEVTYTYVGALSLILMSIAFFFNRQKRVYFFAGGVILTTIFANGMNNPIGLIVTNIIPGWRVFGGHMPERILAVTVFCLAVVAAYGFSIYQSKKRLILIGLIALFVLLLIARLAAPRFGLVTLNSHIQGLPITILLQCLALNIAVIGIDCLLSWRGVRLRGVMLALVLVLAVDQIAHDEAYGISVSNPEMIYSAQPVTQFLLTHSTPTDRFLSVRPTVKDLGYYEPENGPQYLVTNSAPVYGLQETNGYNSLQLSRYREFLHDLNGVPVDYHLGVVANAVSPLFKHLGVRYIVTNSDPKTHISIFSLPLVGHYNLKADTMGIEVTNKNRGFATNQLIIDSTLAHSTGIPQGTPIGRMVLSFVDGTQQYVPFRAGIEVSEHAYDRPDVAQAIKHQKAPIAKTWPLGDGWMGNTYRATINFDSPKQIDKIYLELTDTRISWTVESVSAVSPAFQAAKSVFKQGDIEVFELYQELPRAYLVHGFEEIAGDDETLDRMRDSTFDPRLAAILNEPLSSADAGLLSAIDRSQDQPAPDDAVEVIEYQPNSVRLAVSAESAGVVVLNDNYYPAWVAYIDGKPAEVYRANFTFRGVVVPAGEHIVEVRYESKAFLIGAIITVLTLGIIVIGTVLFLRSRKRLRFRRIDLGRRENVR